MTCTEIDRRFDVHTLSGQRTGDDAVEVDERLRARVHGMWAAVATSWSEHASYVDARGAGVTARMLELAAPAAGERVLELACGPAGVGLAAARLVGPTGEVVVTDIAAGMTEIAAARAAALGLQNVRARVRDLEQIDEPDGSFDVVLCREGLMFAVDPARASREIARVLRPGGRVAIAVWGARARNPWLGVVFDAASAQLGKPLPPPGVPNPFSLGDAGRLAEALRAGALDDVAVSELPTPLRAASFEEWWRRTRGLAGPLSAVLDSLPESALQGLESRLRAAVSPYETASGVELPGVTLIASARR
jgi:SAM-dependent methyltransferase